MSFTTLAVALGAADQRDSQGQFAVLECIDRWYSLDVRLYGSLPC